MQPKHPIYIISKGRADSRLTSKSLEELNVPYRIVIEECEYDAYAAVIHPKKIITLPVGFRENPLYARPDVGGRVGGGIPARNFVWEHSIKEGHSRHWILDDNIRYFFRLNRNTKIRFGDGSPFALIENFTNRFSNVKMAGMNYQYLQTASGAAPPYYLNTRVYSCILLSNDIPNRWRGKFNEDTDLSLTILKDGWCSMLFNAYLCGKASTHTMKGGNTQEVYKVGNNAEFDNRYTFAKSLYEQHPDVVKITQKYGRWHHQVDYSPFEKNHLKFRDDYVYKLGVNDYGLKCIKNTVN
jgi:hypothetical protein